MTQFILGKLIAVVFVYLFTCYTECFFHVYFTGLIKTTRLNNYASTYYIIESTFSLNLRNSNIFMSYYLPPHLHSQFPMIFCLT